MKYFFRIHLLPVIFLCANIFADQVLYPGVADVGDAYSFVINADPQIGPKDSPHGNERNLYRLLVDFVHEVNTMDKAPAFVVFNGDLVAFPKEPYFADFTSAAATLKPPVVLVHGNHDGRHSDEQFYDAQETLSGIRKAWYAYDCGRWRFVVLPGYELIPEQEFMGDMMNWLDAELAAHKEQPVMIFLHYHLLPVGISQCEYYTLPFSMKKALIEIITRYGNVRYAVSGHVHAGVQSSVKCSWSYKGTNFLIAPSPVEPRNFGEEFPEFLKPGERNEGYYLVADVDGESVSFTGHKIGSNVEYRYPETFPEFSEEKDARALQRIGGITASAGVVNGDFSGGLDGWLHPHRYITDENPGFAWKTCDVQRHKQNPAAYLFVQEKGHGWAYDEHMALYQVIAIQNQEKPVFSCRYFAPVETKSYFGGAYIRLAGYSGIKPLFSMLFHWGAREARVRHLPQVWTYHDFGRAKGLPAFHRMSTEKQIMFWSVPDYSSQWHHLNVDIAQLYDLAQGATGSYEKLGADKLLVELGVWCGMEPGAFGAAYFDDVGVTFQSGSVSAINDKSLEITSETFQSPYGGWYIQGYDK